MISVQIIDPSKDSRWDKFVEDNPLGWICHLSSWKKFLEISFKHIRGYFLALVDNKSGCIRAGLPIYEVKSWLTGNRLVSAPFATLFGPLAAADDQIKLLLEKSIQLSKELKSSYIEIRALHADPIFKNSDFAASLGFKHHYLELDRSLDDVWKGFHRQSIRHKISKALKNNINVRIAESEADLKKFYKLHLGTRKRLSLPLHPYKFFNSMWQNFQPSGQFCLLLALKKNIPIAGMIFFIYKKRASAEYLATDNSFLNFNPNHLLYWEAIKMAHKKACSIFDFGRTSILNTGLIAFKEKWGTKVLDLPTFYYPPEVSRNHELNESSLKYKAIRMICGNTPKSFQKILGDIIYRHVG
jgi:serine/alanine adding enzyme